MEFKKNGDHEIIVETKTKNMLVPLNLSYFQLVIHNAEASYKTIKDTDLTGMYKVDEYVPSQKMLLSINENYWGKKPVIEKIVYEQINDDQTRVLGALSGRYHVMLNIPTASIDQFKDKKDVSLIKKATDSTQTIYLNHRKNQLSDPRVRQALSWATDRKELILLSGDETTMPVTTWIGSNPQFKDARNIFFEKYDVKRAKDLLDKAGWKEEKDGFRYKDGKVLSVRLMTWGSDKALGEATQAQWKKVGVKVEACHVDYNQIMAAREVDDWDASIEAWTTFGNPASMLNAQYAPGGSGNYGGFDDAKTNDLLKKLQMAKNDKERHALTLEIANHVAAQSPAIYLFPRPSIIALNSSLEGFVPHFRQIENVVTADLELK